MKLESFNYVNNEDKELTEKFENNNKHGEYLKRYVLGRNLHSKSIIDTFKNIEGCVDDYSIEKVFNGIPVIKSEEIPKNAICISASMGQTKYAVKKLKSLGLIAISYYTFYKYSMYQSELYPISYYHDFKYDLERNFEKYNKIYSLLSDDKSRKLFEAILNFKITLDLKYLDNISRNLDEQYFDKVLLDYFNTKAIDVNFVDGGGFIGDTSIILLKLLKTNKIYFFEPVVQHLETAKLNLKYFENIEYFNLGLSNKKHIVKFLESDSSSKISEEGKILVQLDTLDNQSINQSINYIKLDIEGSELNAILDFQETIKHNHPALAICVYHKSSHWYEVPELILSIRADYDMYFRHYSEGVWESVMYFIPKK